MMYTAHTPLVIKFGRHKGKSYNDLVTLDPKYCSWLIHQHDFKKNNGDLYKYFIENGIEFDEDYEKKKRELAKYKSEYITFGKYKDEKIVVAFENDPAYCKYMITIENIKIHQKEFVNIIKDLVMTEQTVSER